MVPRGALRDPAHVSDDDIEPYDGVVSVQWRRDGVAVSRSSSGAAMTVRGVSTAECGAFSCAVSVAEDAKIARRLLEALPLQLVVLPSAPVFTFVSPSLSIRRGASATLRAAAVAQPDATLQWFHNGVAVATSPDGACQVPRMDEAALGEYVCHAVNDVADVASTTVVVAMDPDIPVIASNPRASVVGAAGESVSLAVAVHSPCRPAPSFQWMHNGVDIRDACSEQLEVQALRPDLCGVYTCRVFNSAGVDVSTPCVVSLDWFAPTVVSQSPDTVVALGDSARLSVDVSANPAPSYTWTHNGVVMPGCNDSTVRSVVSVLSDVMLCCYAPL
jgi:hypothetical protein